MTFAGLNYLAIVIAAIVAWLAGAVWYMSLGKIWTAAQGLTLGEAARRFATSELCPQIAGSPETIADELEDLFKSGACDGFVLTPTLMPGMFEQFCRAVVPVLQARGLFRREYGGTTLRAHLHD